MGFEGGGVGDVIKNQTSSDFRFPEVYAVHTRWLT